MSAPGGAGQENRIQRFPRDFSGVLVAAEQLTCVSVVR